MYPKLMKPFFLVVSIGVSSLMALSCSVAASEAEIEKAALAEAQKKVASQPVAMSPRGATIEILPNSPADTVRVFYAKLREKRIREAIHLTNLKPAIEGLTDEELKEFAVDFEAIAKLIPAEIEINGEIVSGDKATVTAKLPSADDEKLELQQLELKRSGDHWIILSVDAETEKKIKREGKNYFYALKIDTHQEEARKMLERIAKAQMAHSLQNHGRYGDIKTLIGVGFLPADIETSESTGYVYAVELGNEGRTYQATATPAVYGKTGRISYLLKLSDGTPRVTSADKKGQPLK